MRPLHACLPLIGLLALDDQVCLGQPHAPPSTKQALTLELGGVYRASGTNPDGSAYRGMVALTQESDIVRLTWWIGEQVRHGNGRLAAKTLVVNWGDKDPVIHTLHDGGMLNGVWADRSATATLVRIATQAHPEHSGCETTRPRDATPMARVTQAQSPSRSEGTSIS